MFRRHSAPLSAVALIISLLHVYSHAFFVGTRPPTSLVCCTSAAVSRRRRAAAPWADVCCVRPSLSGLQAAPVDGVAVTPPPEAIFEALMAGDLAGVEEYVRAGGDCGVQDSLGDTPLMLAVESELTAAVNTLIREGGVDVNIASDTTGETPLQLAAYYGYTQLAKTLVNEGGAKLETRNKKGETALTLACFWGNTETVEFLLEAGADPFNRNDAGDVPGANFDSVFVPDTPISGASGGGNGSETVLGPRESIAALLEKARKAPR